MAFHHVWAEWSQWFWPSAINHLWQATLFALLVWAAMLALRQASPQMRYAAWLLAMAKFLLPVAWLAFALDKLGLRFSRAESLAADFSTSALILVEIAEPVAEIAQPITHQEVYCVLTLVWLLGMLAVLVNWQVRRWRLAQLLHVESAPPERIAELFAELQRQLGFKRHIPLIVSARIVEPGVWGIRRPKVVLPPGLDERLGDDELRAVLMHGLFHIEQRDNLLGTVQMIVCALFWFHPLVWLIDRKLMDECELMCDEKVIRFGGAAESYAAGLWKVVQHGLGWPVAGVSRVTGSNLKRRIELMLKTDYSCRPALRQRTLAGLMVTLLVALTFAVGILPRAGMHAQNQRSKPGDNLLTDGGPATGVSGGVASGVGKGIAGGPSGGIGQGLSKAISGGEAAGVSGGVPGGVEGALNIQPEKNDRQESNQQQALNKWQLIEQAPEFVIQIDSSNGSPLLIRNAIVKTLIGDGDQVLTTPQQAGKADRLISQFHLTLLNQTEKAVKSFQYEVENPGILARLELPFSNASRSQVIAPSDSLSIGKESLVHYRLREGAFSPTAFTVRVTKVVYEDGTIWGNGSTQRQDDEQAKTSAQQEEDKSILPMSASRRPKILYREKASYTKEARDQKVEGTVVLNPIPFK
ncbi:MAG: M56 family metallopeptidase [Acidobacteriota bacterium]